MTLNVLLLLLLLLGQGRGELLELSTKNFPNWPLREDSGPLDKVPGPWFVMLYVSTCKVCKAAMPVWDEFAEGGTEGLNIGRVDCAKYKDICSLMKANTLPAFRYHSHTTGTSTS